MMMEEVMKDIKSKLKCGRRGGGSDGILHAALIDRSRRRRRFARSRPPGKPLILSRDRGPYARAHEYRVLSSPDRPSDRRISEFDRHLPKFGHVFRSPLLPSPLLFSSLLDNDRSTKHFRETIFAADRSLMPILLLASPRYSRDG